MIDQMPASDEAPSGPKVGDAQARDFGDLTDLAIDEPQPWDRDLGLVLRADLCSALPEWIAKNYDLGERTRARLEALAARVANGCAALTTDEMVEVYDAAPSKKASADVMARKTFEKLIKTTEASAKKRKAELEAAQRAVKKAKLRDEKDEAKARKAAEDQAQKAAAKAEKEAAIRAKKRSNASAKERDALLKRLACNDPLRYDGVTDADREAAHTHNQVLLATFVSACKDVGEGGYAFDPPTEGEAFDAHNDDGDYTPSYFRVGSSVPSILMSENAFKEWVANHFAPWLSSHFDMAWWQDAADRRDQGDIKVFAAMFCNPKSPLFMFEAEDGLFYLWSGNVFEESKAAQYLTIMQNSLHVVYKYREQFLRYNAEKYRAKRTLFGDIVVKSFRPGIDKPTDDQFRAMHEKVSQAAQLCEEQRSYYARHMSEVCVNRTMHNIAMTKSNMSTLTLKPVGCERVWDAHPELIGTDTGVIDWGNDCVKNGFLFRAGHPTDFCRARLGGNDWDPQYDEYVRTGVWKDDKCGHPCPAWIRFLEDLCGKLELERRVKANKWRPGQSAASMRHRIREELEFFQVFFGKSASGVNDMQKFLAILDGSGGGGGQGKSLLIALNESVLGGTLFHGVTPSALVTDPRAGVAADNGHESHLSTLQHPHIGTINEAADDRSIWHTKNSKGPSTTHGPITIRLAHGKTSITFTPKSTVWGLMNVMPAFMGGEVDGAIIRRLVLWILDQRFLDAPDKTKFNEHEVDPNVSRRVLREVKGILAWWLRGMWLYAAEPGEAGTGVEASAVEARLRKAQVDPAFMHSVLKRLAVDGQDDEPDVGGEVAASPNADDEQDDEQLLFPEQGFLVGLNAFLRSNELRPEAVRKEHTAVSAGAASLKGKALVNYLSRTTFWKKNHSLPKCASLKANSDQYVADCDSVKAFIAECCELTGSPDGKDSEFGVMAFYSFFRSWCKAGNGKAIKRLPFKKRVLRITDRRELDSNGKENVFAGLGWKVGALVKAWYVNELKEQGEGRGEGSYDAL